MLGAASAFPLALGDCPDADANIQPNDDCSAIFKFISYISLLNSHACSPVSAVSAFLLRRVLRQFAVTSSPHRSWGNRKR